MNKHQNRREFIRSTSTGIIGFGLASGSITEVSTAYGAGDKVAVAVIRNEKAISTRNICDEKQVALIVEKALFTVTGKQNAKEAWISLGVTKNDIVGIKVNCNSWTFLLSTHPELVYALCDSLSSVVPPNNIIIYERYTSELTRAGYKANKGKTGVRCFGTNEGGGFNRKDSLSRIVTDMCTKIINIPSLKTVEDEFAGSLFLKNHIGTVPPNQMSKCHGNAEFCTEVCASYSIKNKTVLAVCDGLRGTYKRGVPWYWSGIIMSRDQIAAEYSSLQVINEKRIMENDRPLKIPSYVNRADTAYGLGTCNPANIDIVKYEL